MNTLLLMLLVCTKLQALGEGSVEEMRGVGAAEYTSGRTKISDPESMQ
jgi:hypothetical protein